MKRDSEGHGCVSVLAIILLWATLCFTVYSVGTRFSNLERNVEEIKDAMETKK